MRIKKKLKNKKGVTLIEMLAAVLVLTLLALMIQTGIAFGMKNYYTTTARSEMQTLLSTLGDVLTNEFRYARDIYTVGDTNQLERYTSVFYGRNTTLTLEDGQLFANRKRMLASGAYGNGEYKITQFDVHYGPIDSDVTSPKQGVFKITIEIESAKTELVENRILYIDCLSQ